MTLALALQARNSFITGKPQIVRRRIDTPVSLSGYMQELYGARASTEVLVTERLNRIRTPHLIPAGTWFYLLTLMLWSSPLLPISAWRRRNAQSSVKVK